VGLFRVSGWFVNHDYKYTGLAELVVERDVAPTEAEAEPLLWPLADAQLERVYPGALGEQPTRRRSARSGGRSCRAETA